MPSKRRLEQLKNARLVAAEQAKKRKIEVDTTLQPGINDQLCNVHTSDTSDTDDSEEANGTWFWNLSVNESCSDSEEEPQGKRQLDEGGLDVELEEPRSEEAVPLRNAVKEIRWNKEGENNLKGSYGKGSRSTKKRQRKATKELAKEAAKTHNIIALWQRNRDLGLISKTNSQLGLPEPGPESESNPSPPDLSVPPGFTPPQSHKEQQIEALNDMPRLIELVTEQEKKYGDRLSPHSNYYQRHVMVQQFLQTQLKSQPSQTRRGLSLTIARGFGRGHQTGRNIVR